MNEKKNDVRDDEEMDRDFWYPTPDQMDSYLSREEELASSNLRIALQSSRFPQSFRELKESCLHTTETLEIALRNELSAGRVKEDKGRFYLA